MLLRNFLIIVFLFTISLSYSQIFGRKKPTILDCLGAVNITESGLYTLQFTGANGIESKSFMKYMKDTVSRNVIWSYFEPEDMGTIDINLKNSNMKLFCFETTKQDPCNDIVQGNSKLVLYKSELDTTSLWNLSVQYKKMYFFVFVSEQSSTEKLAFDFIYTMRDKEGGEIKDEKIVDIRNSNTQNYTYIKIRNARTKKPVVVNLTIYGTKEIEGLYQASDLYLNIVKGNKSLIKTDTKGYFSKDVQYKFNSAKIDTILIDLEPITIGASVQFDDIQFQKGTSIIMKSSEKKLKRIVDFMALNAYVNIEIQGHVNDKSKKNKKSSLRLSKQRAKRVLKYLVHNGIHPSRMTAVGYGNSKPIYPEPKKGYEEQANRRVEILIK
ncbi:MAG: hypothetical protein RLZ10_1553 [Bacteroidota bacterium]|jgi:outer membrane protein OmpA-like peptidoglycan-associated protein